MNVAILLRVIACVTLLAGSTAWAQTEAFLQRLLRVAGISAVPSAQKGPGDELERGDVWIASLADRTRLRLTRGGGYRSPVFAPGDQSVLALKESTLVTIPPGGGEANAGHVLKGASKLVGFSSERPGDLLVVFDADSAPWLGFVTLASGQVTRLPHDRSSREHRTMIAHVMDWERVYGDTTLYVKAESKQGLTGPVEWTDVYLKRRSEPVNVSRCDGVSCGQPSLSPDGSRVVFVKTAQ
jgi:hypothetical protein